MEAVDTSIPQLRVPPGVDRTGRKFNNSTSQEQMPTSLAPISKR